MRVAMLAGNPLRYDGRVLRHAAALAAAGHQVTLLGVVGPNDATEPPPPMAGVTVRRLWRRRQGVLPRLLWAVPAARRRLAERLVGRLGPLRPLAELVVAPCAPELFAMAAAVDADVYHANDLDTLPPAAWAAGLRGRRYIYDAHELYVDESPELSPAVRAARRRVEGTLIGGAAATITVNDLLADELAALYAVRRPTVLHNVPARVERPPRLPLARRGAERPLRVLFHGAWVGLEQPGVTTALDAVALVPDVRLTLRGGVRDPARLRARLADLGIAGRVRLEPPLPGAERLVAAAIAEEQDVGLSVHLPDCLSRRLATSSKVFEYLMGGLAVVAGDLDGNRHLLGRLADGAEVGLLYPPGDARALAGRLVELADDPARLQRMQESARLLATRRLCWEAEAERLLALYANANRP